MSVKVLIDMNLTFTGSPIDDADLLELLPADLIRLLQQVNGFIQFHGGLHVRGACQAPAWHSLRDAWLGDNAFHRLYPEVRPDDIPFAEDCMGDQFLLRGAQVWQLETETGQVKPRRVALPAFLQAVQADPVAYLSLQPLIRFREEGGTLEAGWLLGAFPPFCLECPGERRLAPISSDERRRFLAYFAGQIREVADGGKIVLVTSNEGGQGSGQVRADDAAKN
jgi:hypothetical protein